MRRMPSQIELYEEMCRLSSHMAAAARERDWDSLVELERDVGHLRQALLAAPDDDGLVADIAVKRNLIQRILDDDAEVRRHTEPWMERVRHFLGDAERMRYIQQASLGDAEAAPN
jgi:flagellar protein FliT